MHEHLAAILAELEGYEFDKITTHKDGLAVDYREIGGIGGKRITIAHVDVEDVELVA